MCHAISWKEKGDWLYFLTNDDLQTSAGQELRRFLGDKFSEDIIGHGAIDKYFELRGWAMPENAQNMECTDFSSPDNFPLDISQALRAGKFSRLFGFQPGLLTAPAQQEYEKIKAQARQGYEKIEAQAFWSLWMDVKNRAEVWK